MSWLDGVQPTVTLPTTFRSGYVTVRCANGHTKTLRFAGRAIRCPHWASGYRCPLVARVVR